VNPAEHAALGNDSAACEPQIHHLHAHVGNHPRFARVRTQWALLYSSTSVQEDGAPLRMVSWPLYRSSSGYLAALSREHQERPAVWA
jgi:hypothetical protein